MYRSTRDMANSMQRTAITQPRFFCFFFHQWKKEKNNSLSLQKIFKNEKLQKPINHTTSLMSEAHYYPFGLQISELSFNKTQPKNKYLYNGKELQDDFGLGWLDYGKRFYDAEVPRFTSIDPLAEKYYSISPYAYVADNPIRFIDPNGEDIWISYSEQQARRDKEGNVKTYKRGKRKGQVKYKTVTKTIQYKVGMSGIGNEFADNVINSLNLLDAKLGELGGEFGTMISDIASNNQVNLSISQFNKLNGEFSPSRSLSGTAQGDIRWNTELGLVGDITNPNSNTNRIPPIISLFHELGHAKISFDEKLRGLDYTNKTQQHLTIVPYEGKLSQSLGYGARSNDISDIGIYRALTVTSTKGKQFLYNTKRILSFELAFSVGKKKFYK